MKFIFPYRYLVLFTTLLCIGCKTDEPAKKQSLEQSLRYFDKQNGIEHTVTLDNQDLAYIQLPDCFTEDLWDYISLTNNFVYMCGINNTYLSVDPIPKDEINYYKSYFIQETIKDMEAIDVLLKYVLDIRSSSLTWPSTSTPLSEVKTESGEKMLLGSVKGISTYDNNEVFYQYGVIEGKDHYFIIQAYMSIDNAKLLSEDFMTIFKTFETD